MSAEFDAARLFAEHKVKVMGSDVALIGFDLSNQTVVAVCRQGKRKARVTLDSVQFPELTKVEKRWLQAWKQFSAEAG